MKNANMNHINKIALAAAAAALFSSAIAPVAFAAEMNEEATVKCQGINSCKGTSKCATAENACAGQNKCKGHGWIPAASKEACTAKGGTVL